MSSEADDRCSNTKPKRPHFLLVPLMEQGHMIPMVDLARLLAARNTLVTFATTPVNLARIRPIIDQAAASALSIRFVELRFPVTDAGLPEGCENVDLLPSAELMFPFLKAVSLLRDPLEAHLRLPDPAWPKPACLISDNLHHWTADVARALDIPRLIFHGPPCLILFCSLLINKNRAELEAAVAAASDGTTILPGLPHPIRVGNYEVNWALSSIPDWSKYMEIIQAAEESADGVVVNSFTELEPWYFDKYREATGKLVWPIGPLSLYKEELDLKAARGRISSTDNKVLFQWLDRQEAGSVLLVSFGSVVRRTMAQIVELGHGLEASGRPFVWVMKESAAEVEEWISELEKRVEGRGMVIRGWAPQTVILSHAAVGGFMTHCGWNSTLEAVAAGVVMATWPHEYDQFLNAQFVVEVLKTGVSVGVDELATFGLENGNEAAQVIGRGVIEGAVERLMGGGEEAEERRERAKLLGEKARSAMEEGGSSWKGLQDVINYVLERQKE